MKIAVMGTGGVGGYYGGLLARAGYDVVFIARGAHLAAIREKGLQIKSVHGDFLVSPAGATDRPAEVGEVDLVLFATKTYHTDQAAQLIKPMVGRDTVILPLQNGVDAVDRIGPVVGADHVLGGATWLSAAIEGPGVIGHYSQFRRIAIGEFNGLITPRARSVFDALKRTEATIELVENIVQILWTKFVFIAGVSALGGLTRVTLGEYRSVPEARRVLTDVMKEVVAVARAKGVALDAEVIDQTLKFIDESAPGIKPSFQRDIEAGRMSELESLIGIVVQFGAQLGIPTPIMRIAYAVLEPGELKARA